MVRHIRDKIAKQPYKKRRVWICAHYFALCEICSNRGGKPTFPATLKEIAHLSHCSTRWTQVCLEDLLKIGAISRSRQSRGRPYIWTLLALPKATEVRNASSAPSGTYVPHQSGRGVPGYKNKVHIRVPTLSELLGISGTSKNNKPQKKGGSVEMKQQNQNGKPPL
jgi:hypothetical protein